MANKFKVGDFVLIKTMWGSHNDNHSYFGVKGQLKIGDIVRIDYIDGYSVGFKGYNGGKNPDAMIYIDFNDIEFTSGYQSPLWKVLNGEEL